MKEFSLPGYEVLQEIGRGGMSVVWKARQLSLDRVVAIKVLTQESMPDAEARKLFQTEARAAAKLNHPGIIQVYDAGEHAGLAYYVMEYVQGESVGDILARQARMTDKEAVRIATDIARALQYAWDRARIIHCDIKPDNLLMSRDSGVKVADLGLARFFSHAQSEHSSEVILGTPNYISPEQAQGLPDLDCRADIYSLGATLYHMVTGVLPFAGSPGSSAMDRHIDDYLPDPTDYNPQLASALAWLVEKMLVKDRMLRHQTWTQVLADLAEVEAGRSPIGLPEKGASTVRRSDRRGVLLRPPTAPQGRTAAPKKPIVVTKQDADLASQMAVDGQRRQRKQQQLVGAFVGAIVLLVVAGVGYLVATGQNPLAGLAGPKEPVVEPIAPPPSVTPVVQAPPDDMPPPRVDPSVTPVEPAPVVQVTPDPNPVIPNQGTSPLRPSIRPPEPTPVPEPPVVARPATPGEDWQNPNFVAGARAFNRALEMYKEYQASRKNPEQLKLVEANLRRAITLFERCKGLESGDVDIGGYIQQCNKLIFDVRQSTTAGAHL